MFIRRIQKAIQMLLPTRDEIVVAVRIKGRGINNVDQVDRNDGWLLSNYVRPVQSLSPPRK